MRYILKKFPLAFIYVLVLPADNKAWRKPYRKNMTVAVKQRSNHRPCKAMPALRLKFLLLTSGLVKGIMVKTEKKRRAYFQMGFPVGSTVEGRVIGITKFGAFVELPDGANGLVHISEVADSYVKDVKDFIKENDMIKVKVLNVGENGKIGLSIKQVVKSPGSPPKGDSNFEDKLSKFMKDSNEKLIALKHHQEYKRKR
jgi:S1 RNA binding domain protein